MQEILIISEDQRNVGNLLVFLSDVSDTLKLVVLRFLPATSPMIMVSPALALSVYMSMRRRCHLALFQDCCLDSARCSLCSVLGLFRRSSWSLGRKDVHELAEVNTTWF